MPRDGAITLSDVRQPTLELICDQCGRRGRYGVPRFLAKHGNAKPAATRQSPRPNAIATHRFRRAERAWPRGPRPVRPAEAIFGEALRELTERVALFYEEAGRDWFSTQPTLKPARR
jgi:hypothetical protein